MSLKDLLAYLLTIGCNFKVLKVNHADAITCEKYFDDRFTGFDSDCRECEGVRSKFIILGVCLFFHNFDA